MNQIVQINGQSLPVHIIEGQPVISTKQVADLHNVPFKNVQMNFKNNRKHFVEGEDFFKEFEPNPQTKNFLVSRIYLTETGYLLLSKSFKDDLSWQIMKHLVACYFKVKNQVQIATPKPQLQLEFKDLLETKCSTLLRKIIYYRTLGNSQYETALLCKIPRTKVEYYESFLGELGYTFAKVDRKRFSQKRIA